MRDACGTLDQRAGAAESHQDRTNAETAVRFWHMVSSGFPPPLLMRLGEDQVSQGGDSLMAHQPHVRTAVKIIAAQFRFLIFKRAFHAPLREGHMHQFRHWRVLRRIGHDRVQSKTETDIRNKVLAKILWHKICCPISALYELASIRYFGIKRQARKRIKGATANTGVTVWKRAYVDEDHTTDGIRLRRSRDCKTRNKKKSRKQVPGRRSAS